MSKYADNVVRIPCSFDSFFAYWVEFLKPFHKLTDREGQILALFLKERYRLSKIIHDEDILDNVLMSEETRIKIRDEGAIGVQHIYAVTRSFERKKVIIDGKINKRFLPNIVEENGNYKLMFLFEFKDEKG